MDNLEIQVRQNEYARGFARGWEAALVLFRTLVERGQTPAQAYDYAEIQRCADGIYAPTLNPENPAIPQYVKVVRQ